MSPNHAQPMSPWVRAIACVVIALSVVILAGLFLVNYSSMLALALGLLAGAIVLWLIGSRRVQALVPMPNAAQGRWVQRRWRQRATLALLLVPLLTLPVLLAQDAFRSVLPRLLRGDGAAIVLILLSALLAAEPIRAGLSFLRARARGKWRGWRWVQRLLVTALLAALLLPAFIVLALALATGWGVDAGILLLVCAALALAAIGLLSWQIEVLFLPTVTRPPDRGWRGWAYGHRGLIAFLLAALLFALWLLVLQGVVQGFKPAHVTLGLVKTYTADIEPSDLAQGAFTVQESGTSNLSGDSSETKTYSHEAQVQSTRRGILLREVHIAPLDMDAAGRVRLEFEDGTSLETAFCDTLCPQSTVTLLNMPASAFYDARDATVTQRDPYIDTETISLSIRDLRRGIVFAYVRPPFHHLAFLLRPFIGTSAASHSALAFFGFIGLVIAVPILRPARFRQVKETLRAWFTGELRAGTKLLPAEDDLEWLAQASQAAEDEGDVPLSRDQRVALYRLLAIRLDESDLRALYFSLDLPYDSLTGGGTIDHARELVVYCTRTQRLDELLRYLAQERPDLDLDEWGQR